jgi:sterol desaturase/sphingolipid hydroxylase (fatty acid hydroxylase superfamily)/uncharacterized protein (DUF2147 family)
MDIFHGWAVETIGRAVGVYLQILPFDFSRYAIGAGGVYALVNLALRRRLAGRKVRDASPDWRQMRREIAASMRTVLIFAAAGLGIYFGIEAGFIGIERSAGGRGWGYFALNVAVLIFAHDAWFYWTHRLIHHPKLFRRAHGLHHKSRNPSPWTAYSFNSAEAAINAAFLPPALVLIPSSELAMFAFLAHMMLRNAVGHCGYELFPAKRDGRPMFDWLTTVTHHDLHHAEAGWNYGLYFTFWDRLMGTEHPLYHEKFAASVRTPLDGSAIAAIGRSQTVRKARPGPRAGFPHADRTVRNFPVAGVPIAALLLAAALMAGAARADNRPEISAPDPQALAGLWASEGHGAHIRLAACADDPDALCGDLVWAWDGALLANRLDGPKLSGFRWDGGAWAGGKLFNPEDERVYRGSIAPQADGSLKFRGCAFVFCDSQIWRRVEDIPGCVDARRSEAAAARSLPMAESADERRA